MKRIVFDAETNGLLHRPDLAILCAAGIDVDTREEFEWRPGDFDEMVWTLEEYDVVIGHNVAGFDVPLIRLLFPTYRFRRLFDTRLVARQRLIADQRERLYKYRNRGRTEESREARLPKRLLAKPFALETFGCLLGYNKGDFLKDMGVQEEFSEELLGYCMRDVRLTLRLYEWLHEEIDGRPAPPDEAMFVESMVGYLLGEQERNGVRLDVDKANALYASLAAKREALSFELRDKYFPPWLAPAPGQKGAGLETKTGDAGYTVPSRTYRVEHPHPLAGRESGCAFTKIELREFNPASGHHIADRLTKLYGWKPREFTNTGLPTVDEKVLSGLDMEPAKLLTDYLLLQKRIGQLAEGQQAWLKLVDDDGLLHGIVEATGARTSRMSHRRPNKAQVPRVTSPYGAECRELFLPTRDWPMLGFDASGIELRMMAHRLAFYDDGAFVKVVLDGDVHDEWQKATGFFTRDGQKTCSYAFIYGAGDTKLGNIFIDDWHNARRLGLTDKPAPPRSSAMRLGRQIRRRLLDKVTGLERFVWAAKAAFKRGWVKGLDGRAIVCKSEHGVLNDVFQSDAAVVMKWALVNLWENVVDTLGWVPGLDFELLLNVHDEWQFGVKPDLAETLGGQCVAALELAGRQLGLRCPLAGDWKVGANWKETH